jgi:hypothetical protein
VHSYFRKDLNNSHWKERVLERGKDIPDDVFDEILSDLKMTLMKNKDIVVSKQNPNRVLVKGIHNLVYVLEK